MFVYVTVSRKLLDPESFKRRPCSALSIIYVSNPDQTRSAVTRFMVKSKNYRWITFHLTVRKQRARDAKLYPNTCRFRSVLTDFTSTNVPALDPEERPPLSEL